MDGSTQETWLRKRRKVDCPGGLYQEASGSQAAGRNARDNIGGGAIIQLDIDFFYGQVEQLTADPSLQLNEKPFAIYQKHILVTCNYIARKQGVRKLQVTKEAKQLCPDLILINGEDLTKYRDASLAIRRLAQTLVWDAKVEKLGMDELFCDVEKQCHAHLQDLKAAKTYQLDTAKEVFFNLCRDRKSPEDRSFGFTYLRDPEMPHTGHRLPEYDPRSCQTKEYPGIKVLEVASHLAAHIRDQIFVKLGLTSSAGISCNKLLAKLAADLHKPALQTLMDPGPITDDSIFGMGINVQPFMDPMKVEKLNGFGWRTGKTLRNRLLGEPEPARGTYGDADKVDGTFEGEARPFFAQQDDERIYGEFDSEMDEQSYEKTAAALDGVYGMTLEAADANQRPHMNNLTVRAVRTSSSLELFNEWFGSSITNPNGGPRLWSILHGRDTSKVVPTGDFPKQIGVEDSWLETRTLEDLIEKTRVLCQSLIRRLEHELTERPGLEDDREESVWKRYPTQLRLSLRNGRQVARESRTVRMPIEIFDAETKSGKGLSQAKRAGIMINVLLPAIRSILRMLKPGWNINVINVVATDLKDPQHYKFTKGIGAYLSEDMLHTIHTRNTVNSSSGGELDSISIDWEFIQALPEDIRKEILHQYGLSEPKGLSDTRSDAGDVQLAVHRESNEDLAREYKDPQPVLDGSVEDICSDEEDDAMHSDHDLLEPSCPDCGERVYPWMADAHTRFHRMVAA